MKVEKIEKIRVTLSLPNEIIDGLESYRNKFLGDKFKDKSKYFSFLLSLYLPDPSYFTVSITYEDVIKYSAMPVSKKNNFSFYIPKEQYAKLETRAVLNLRTTYAEVRLFIYTLYKYFKPLVIG